MDLRSLAVFVRVGERRSFVRAAKDLGMTQSGVSNAINRLEDQLGVRLLARTTRSVNLTEDGAAFFERCRRVLAELDEAERVLTQARLKPTGRLHVDLPVSFGRLKIVPLLGAFRAEYPEMPLVVSFTDRYVDLVEDGIDIAIRVGALPDSSLIVRRLTLTQFSVVASPAYFARYGKPGRPQDIASHNCMGFLSRESGTVRDWQFRDGDARFALPPHGDISLNDGTALFDLACAGHGLVQLQDYFTDAAIASGQLEMALEAYQPDAIPVSLIYPQTRHLSPKVRAFVDFLTAHFALAAASSAQAIDHQRNDQAEAGQHQ